MTLLFKSNPSEPVFHSQLILGVMQLLIERSLRNCTIERMPCEIDSPSVRGQDIVDTNHERSTAGRLCPDPRAPAQPRSLLGRDQAGNHRRSCGPLWRTAHRRNGPVYRSCKDALAMQWCLDHPPFTPIFKKTPKNKQSDPQSGKACPTRGPELLDRGRARDPSQGRRAPP